MHKFIFQDIFDWAGEPRTIAIYKEEGILQGQSVEYSDPGDIMGGKVLELESDKLIKKGEQIGKQIGKKAVTELTKKLLAENRLDDLKRSVEDPAYQRKLLQEMENTK